MTTNLLEALVAELEAEGHAAQRRGSNAGDLILAWPDGDHGWRIAGDPWAFLSIGLATLVELEVFVPDPETKE